MAAYRPRGIAIRAAESVSGRKPPAFAGMSRALLTHTPKPHNTAMARKTPKKEKIKKESKQTAFFTL
jgi:hypothetical protein